MSAISQQGPIGTNVRTVPMRDRVKRGAFGLLMRVAPRTAARLAARMFFTPDRGVPSERMTKFLSSGERFTLESGSVRIQGWKWGAGPPVYLIHGWSGRGGQLSAFVEPLVARGFTVITFDAPGHGESAGNRSSLIAFANALRDLVDAFGPADGVIAHSLGGAAAAHAAHRGLDVPRLVVIGTPSEPGRFFGEFVADLGLEPSLAAWIRHDLEKRIGFLWDELSFQRIGPKQGTPLLVVHDRADKEVPFSEGEVIANAWPGARVLATSGLGHRRILHDSGVVREIVDFISLKDSIESPAASRQEG
jgi:pimeloyl-ACP methyl ester carboxylesterase